MKDFSDAPSWVPSEGSSLDDLIARVEAATRPDRDLDALIHVALYQPKDWRPTCRIASKPGRVVIGYVSNGRRTSGVQLAPDYTSSLDDALAMAERCGIDVAGLMGDATSETYHWVEHVESYRQRLVLSILAALLRALQAQPLRHNARDGASQ